LFDGTAAANRGLVRVGDSLDQAGDHATRRAAARPTPSVKGVRKPDGIWLEKLGSGALAWKLACEVSLDEVRTNHRAYFLGDRAPMKSGESSEISRARWFEPRADNRGQPDVAHSVYLLKFGVRHVYRRKPRGRASL
jgi:hypothetical protein